MVAIRVKLPLLLKVVVETKIHWSTGSARFVLINTEHSVPATPLVALITKSEPARLKLTMVGAGRALIPNVPFTAVRASRGKVTRAEPVAALYEQSRVHHVGTFAELEDQMCGFTTDFDRQRAGYSPDRVDALVWALTDLLVEPMSNEGIFELF